MRKTFIQTIIAVLICVFLVAVGATAVTVIFPSQGGTGKSSWTQYAIPYLSGITTFGEIAIGTAGQYLKVDSGATSYTWGTPAGAGDVTGVGDCADGACLDGSSDGGTYIRLYDGDSNYAELNIGNIASDYIVYLPASTGTLIHTEVDPTVDSAAEILAIIDDTALDFGTGVLTATGFSGPLTGAVTGNASTASALIANGANCNAGNAPLGVDDAGAVESCFDVWTETENTNAGYISATLTEEEVEDFVGTMLGGTETHIAVTYQDASNNIDFVVSDDWYDSVADFSTTLTDTYWCRYNTAGTEINCDVAPFSDEVGTLTNTKWCTTDGSVVNCATDTPVLTEVDPAVDTEAEIEAITGALFGASKVVTGGYIWVADGTDFESVIMSNDCTLASGGAITCDHDALDNFLAAEHIDWAGASAGTIHIDNYIENATHTGDVTGSGALTIAADKVLESHLKAVDEAADEECLTYESTTGDFEWQSCGGTPTVITVADTADTTSYVALWESATGDLEPKSDLGLTYNATTGMLTATGFTGPLTGTASLATALASNPTDCGANQFAQSIVASGNLTCAAITDADVPDNITIDLATLASTITVADESADTSCYVGYFTAASGSLAAKTGTNLTFNSDTGILTATGFAGDLTGAVTGNASTATALAGDPADCAANTFADAINASGTLTCNSVAAADITADTITYTQILDADQATTKCILIETPADADDLMFFRNNRAATVTSVDCIVEAATSAVVVIVECDSAGDNCGTSRFTESLTCDVDGATDDGVAETGIVAGAWLRAQVGTVTGTPGHVTACITFTYDD